MTPEQFCYWLQGKLEGRDILSATFTKEELKSVQDHLATVFKKVTPTAGLGTISDATAKASRPTCTCNSLLLGTCPVHPNGSFPSILC